MLVAVCFVLTSLNIPLVQAQSALPAGGDFYLPAPGVRVGLSPEFNPPILKGIKVNPNNPFRFDFILDQGDSPGVIASEAKQSQQEQLKTEATRLIKYFLASLTIPEGDLWVNLSPYEKDRIIPKSFGLTEMGRDLLAEDYMLKQITASLIYPEGEVGKKFWKRIYEEAAKKFGTTSIPVNTFNKVWIVPEKAVVYENAKAGTAYVVESKLKVMLEQDYLLMSKHVYGGVAEGGASPASAGFAEHAGETRGQAPDINKLGSDIIREIVIPELTREINEGKNFAQLRQVYNSLILATWYKKKIKDSILSQVYADKKKIAGVGYKNSIDVTDIYQRYLQAFKKGVYNYIKEEQDPITQENIPRKYFSGGVELGVTELSSRNILKTVSTIPNPAMIANDHAMIVQTNFSAVDTAMLAPIDRAMNNADNQSAALRVIEEVRSWTRTTESPYPSKERKFSFAHDLAVVLVPKVSGKIDVCLVPDLPNDGVQQALLTIIRSKGMKAVKVQYPYGGQYELIVGSPMPVNRVLRVFEEQKQSKAEFDWALGLALNYPPGAIEKYIGAKKDNAQLAENNTREPDRAMVEEKAGAYQNIVVLPDRRFVNVFDSFEDDVSNPWESNFNMMDMDFRGWDSRLPASPKILCVGGSLREVQWYLRRYPNADITVVNLSRRVLGKLDEFVGNDPKRKQTIHLYLGDVTQLPTALFPQGSFDMVTAIRLEESAYEKYDFAAPLMGIVKAEMGLLKSGGFLVQPWLHGYKAYFQSFGALGLVKPFIRELQDAPPFFYERLAPEQTAGVSGLDHAMTGEIEVGDWFRSKANRNKAFIHAISVIDGIKYFFLTYAKMDKQERLVETGRDKLNLEELSNDFDRIEEPFKVGPAGQKSLSMTRIFGYHEGMRLKDDKDPTLGTGVVIDVDVRKEALTVLYLNGQQVVYNTFDRLTEIVTDDAGQPLPAKRLKATDYSIGEEVRDESRPELGVGHVISFLRDIRLEENGPAKSVLVQYHPAGGEGVQGFVYEEGIQGKNRLVDLVPAPALQGKGDFVTYTREFNDVGSLGTFIAMIDNGDIETPFNIRFDTEKRRYILEIYSSPLSSRLIQSKRISENSGLAADKEAYQQSEYAIATYKGYLDKLSETRDPHKLLDHNQVLFIGPDNQLKEVAYILERYPLIKKVVVAELSLKNVIAMSRKAFELGIQDKVEIVRMDFLKVNDLPGFWKGRFSAAFSCRVFEHTINTFEMIGNGWKAIQKVLARPGLFIGHLDLTDQGLAPSSTTDMLTVKEKALQREDDRMVVIADRAMVVKDKVDRGRVSLAYKKLRIDKTQFPQWRQQTQLLQVLEALRDRHWQVGEQVEEVVGEIAKERKDLLGMGVLPIMIDSLINERHVFRDRRSTAIEDAIRNRPDLISESVVSDLMNALKINKYYDVLEPGIKALGDIAAVRGDLINNEAVSILLTLLAHKESSIFEAAAVALGKIIKSRPEYVEEIWSKIPDITKIREEPQLGSAAALLGEIAKSQKTKLETAIQILLKMMNKRR